MGFNCGIYKINKDKLPYKFIAKDEFDKIIDHLYEYNRIKYEDVVIDDWCSNGNIWFEGLKDSFKNYASEKYDTLYIIDKTNYIDLVNIALKWLEEIKLEDYYIDKSITYIDTDNPEDEDAYICRNIDGVKAHNDDGVSKEFWCCNEEPTFMTTAKYMDGYMYDGIYRFIQAVLRMGTIDWDNEIVWINGGW